MVKFRELFAFKKLEIDYAFKNAKINSQVLGLKLLEAPLLCSDSEEKRIGKILIVTPRKSGKSHERNKIRRQVKSIFYEEKLYENHIASILLVYKQAQKLTFDNLKTFLTNALQKKKAK